jgi:general stress protein 26
MNVIARGKFSPISDPNAYNKLWDMMDSHETFMMTTIRGEQLRSRPMVGYSEKENNTVWFLADKNDAKDDEIEKHRQICISLHKNSHDYVSLSGQALIVDNLDKKKELWNIAAQAWFKKPIEDPDIILIAFTPEYGEYWQSNRSGIGTFFEMAKALISNERPNLGENKKVNL